MSCRPAVSVVALLFALLAVPFQTRPAAATYGVPVPSRLLLTVRETAGVARAGEVVRSGVPLPRSLNVLSTSRLAVVDGSGRAVPADFQVTARWNAGLSDTAAPIQWLMVSFPATVGARGSVSYRLVTDGSVANPAPARPLQVTRSGNAFTVDTGAAIFRFGTDPGALFDEVLLANGTRLVGGGTLSLLSGGLSARHPTVRRVWVEHAGPLFAAVVVTGAYDLPAIGNGQIGSIRRYVFTAGSPTAVIRHVANWEGNLGCQGCVATSAGAPNGVRFDQIRDTLTVALGSSPTVTAVGAFASPAVTASVPAGRTAAVRQLLRGSRQEALRFQVDVNGTAASGVQATGGMLAASGPSGAVAIALDQMHRYEPQALRMLADGSLAVDVADDKVWVAHHQGLFATLAVSALAAGPSRSTLDSQVWAPLNHPLRAWPEAAWFASSEAVEEFPVGPLPADLASYDTLLPSVFNRTVQQIDKLGLAGLTTFGVYPRYWGKDGAPGEIDCGTSGDPTPNEAWDNKFWCSTWADYHNTASTIPVWAMRSGQVEWLDDLGAPAALRTLHTQIMQCGPTEKWYYCGQAPAGYAAYRSDFNSSHAYFENLFEYYWLTGDSTVVEILRRGGENARRNMCDTRGPRPVVEPITGPGGPACAPDYPSSTSEFTGRVATQWINAFRFLGLASPDGSFLDDYRGSLARAATQHYVEVHRAGETKTYGFLGERAVTPGTYIGGPIWMYGFYDTNTMYRLLRDTGDAPIGLPAMTPSHLLATVARTLKDIEPSVQGDGTVKGDWPKNLEYTYLDSRIGGTLADVIPNDRPIFTPEKCSVTALFLRAGELSGDASLITTGTDMVHFTLSAAAGEAAPLGKLEGQYLGRLHAAIAHLVNNGGTPPPPPPPSAPSTLTAQAASDTAIQLTWQDGSNNEDGFRVEQSINGTFQEIQTTAADDTGATVTGLAAGTSYTFRVQAFNAGGTSSYTASASATTKIAAPAAPSNLVAQTVSASEIQLTWQDNAGTEDSFRVEQSVDGTTFQEVQATAANATGARISGLNASTAYTFRVRAANTTGSSAYSNSASATTAAPALAVPAAPSNLVAQAVSSTDIQLTWQDNSDNETNFLLERLSNGVFTQFNMRGSNVTSFRVTGLTPGTQYTFRVRAKNTAGNSGYSNTATATTLPSAGSVKAPAAPTRLVARAVSPTEVELTWKDNSKNETDFRIEKRIEKGAGGTFQEIRQVNADTMVARIAGLQPGASYTFRIRAHNASGFSHYSNRAQVKQPSRSRR